MSGRGRRIPKRRELEERELFEAWQKSGACSRRRLCTGARRALSVSLTRRRHLRREAGARGLQGEHRSTRSRSISLFTPRTTIAPELAQRNEPALPPPARIDPDALKQVRPSPAGDSAHAPRTLRTCPASATQPDCRYRSVQDAVNAALPGDHVVLAPGVYAEGVIIGTPAWCCAASRRPPAGPRGRRQGRSGGQSQGRADRRHRVLRHRSPRQQRRLHPHRGRRSHRAQRPFPRQPRGHPERAGRRRPAGRALAVRAQRLRRTGARRVHRQDDRNLRLPQQSHPRDHRCRPRPQEPGAAHHHREQRHRRSGWPRQPGDRSARRRRGGDPSNVLRKARTARTLR